MSRRFLEVAILAFGALFLVYLAFSFRSGHHPVRSPAAGERFPTMPAAEQAGEPTTVLKGFDYAETLRGKPLFRIQSARTIGFGPAAGLVPNVYVLEKVTLTVYPEQGEAVTVRSDRAQYDQRTKQARLTGNVVWTDQRGALGETNRLEFEPSRRLLAAPEAVHFTRGSFSLTARSGRYDIASRQMFLDGPVDGSGTGEGSGGVTSLAADAAVYKREEASIELSGHVAAASREGDRLNCDRLVLKLEAEGSRLQWVRADGSVRGVLASAPSSLADSSSRPPGHRQYGADSAAVLFASDGQARSLSLNGSPARVSDSRGQVRAETIDVTLQSGRATAAAARGHVQIEDAKNHAESEQASLSFSPSGEIETMELSGHVRMRGEDRVATSEKAVDLPQRGTWILTSGSGSATVESGGSRVSAGRIDIEENRHLLTAQGAARAVFVPTESKPGQPARKGPALVGDPGKPTYGKAQRLVLDDAAHVATLSGSATLWQDSSSLSGDAITLNDIERSAVAVGNTRTVVLSAGGGKPARQASSRQPGESPSPTVVTAHRVTYREKDSRAVFEGDVVVTRDDMNASADEATAILGSDRRVEQVQMEGSVSLSSQAEGRSGRAEHATDWPREGKTVLEGSPAWVVDGHGNRVSGAVLTITDRGRRVEVTAPPGGKTETIHRTKSS